MPRRDRSVGPSGLLLVDKPAGLTSHDVVARVRRLARTRRVGHTGTLDPDATGLLPLTLGACTKLSNFLTLNEKVYLFESHFGSETTTDDASGEVCHRGDASGLSAEAIERELDSFRGEIMQRPPRYSAVRVDGQRAHELARRGVDFELEARPVIIHELELLGWDAERHLASMSMRCGSGTYVRSVVRDLGRELGCYAHTDMIRRTQVGPFSLASALPLERLEDGPERLTEALLSPAQMMASLPQMRCEQEAVLAWSMGQRAVASLQGAEALKRGERVAMIASRSGALLGVGEIVERVEGEEGGWLVAPKKVLNAQD